MTSVMLSDKSPARAPFFIKILKYSKKQPHISYSCGGLLKLSLLDTSSTSFHYYEAYVLFTIYK